MCRFSVDTAAALMVKQQRKERKEGIVRRSRALKRYTAVALTTRHQLKDPTSWTAHRLTLTTVKRTTLVVALMERQVLLGQMRKVALTRHLACEQRTDVVLMGSLPLTGLTTKGAVQRVGMVVALTILTRLLVQISRDVSAHLHLMDVVLTTLHLQEDLTRIVDASLLSMDAVLMGLPRRLGPISKGVDAQRSSLDVALMVSPLLKDLTTRVVDARTLSTDVALTTGLQRTRVANLVDASRVCTVVALMVSLKPLATSLKVARIFRLNLEMFVGWIRRGALVGTLLYDGSLIWSMVVARGFGGVVARVT